MAKLFSKGQRKERNVQEGRFTNLLTFYEEVSCDLHRGRPVDVVYLAFAKAFHAAPHKCLIDIK